MANADTVGVLVSACRECVNACESLQRLVPELQLTSPFAKTVHELIYTFGGVEAVLHQFIDRELLQEAPGRGKTRETGARLQDALERANGSIKPTIKASLLAGGIASLLHLFSLTLRQLSAQLDAIFDDRKTRSRLTSTVALVSGGLALLSRFSRRSPATLATLRRQLAIVCAAACTRLAFMKAHERRRANALQTSLERLLSTLRLWIMSTSVLQRAQKLVAHSYVELDHLGSSGSKMDSGIVLAESRSMLELAGLLESRANSIDGGAAGGETLASSPKATHEARPRTHSPPSSAGTRMTLSRSYPQLIAVPGLHDVDESRMQPIRLLFERCVPCAATAWWWQIDPVLAVTKFGIEAYYASLVVALRAIQRARKVMPGLPSAVTYVLGGVLLPWFLLCPTRAAQECYNIWCHPDITAMQTIYAPLRWPLCKDLVRLACGRDIEHQELHIGEVRILVLRPRDAAAAAAPPPSQHGGTVPMVPMVPTVLFVPGGAFIADFEAPDLFFLYQWVRGTRATLVYVTYRFAPQAPYPSAQLQVLTVYNALREHTHAAHLGFRASPLVVAGLSAGGNLACSAILAPLLPSFAHPDAQGRLPPRESFRMPDGMLLLCPTLNLARSPSPSRLAFASDPLLPQPLVRAFATAYDEGTEHWMERDPLLSPVFAPDEALQRLPTTCLMAGGLDPLLDDTVDFNTRIRRMGVAGDMFIYRSLPHTFLSFPHWHLMTEVQHAMTHSIDFLNSMLWPAGPEPA